MEIMDCTLRDGANVVGKGFSGELTTLMIKGLITSNIKIIEFGHATGLGSENNGGGKAPLSDEEYLFVKRVRRPKILPPECPISLIASAHLPLLRLIYHC